jgi:hypothetical protein
VLFNICWFACVYAGASGLVLLAPTAVLLFFIVHAKFSNALLLDIQLALVAIVFGALLELLWAATAWIQYPQGELVPLWMPCLWFAFSLTLNSSLAWLQDRPALASLMSLGAAPLCYFTGARLGAVSFIEPVPFLLSVALAWALLIPALLKLTAYWAGQQQGATV